MKTKMKDRTKVITLGIAMLLERKARMLTNKLAVIVAGGLLLGGLYVGGTVQNAHAVAFDITDPNTWALGTLNSTTPNGGGQYTQSWTLTWNPLAGTALDGYAFVGFEWQPAGPGTTADSFTGPAGWSYLGDPDINGGFIGAYANGDGSNSIDAAAYALGILYADTLGPEDFTFTVSTDFTPENYHIQFGHPIETGHGTQYGFNQLSLTADGQVPEPTSLLLIGSGLVGLGLWRRKRSNSVQG